MSFEEEANPIIAKFINDLVDKWKSDARDTSNQLEGEISKFIDEYRDTIIGSLKTHSELLIHGKGVDPELVSQVSLALGKLIPEPLPPEETFIVQAQEAWNKLELALSQAEALNILIETTANKCDGVALFVLKGDKLVGWKSLKLSSEKFVVDKIKEIVLDFKEGSSFYHCQQTFSFISCSPGHFPLDSNLREKFGERNAHTIAIFPLVVKGKCVAFLYCDSMEEDLTMETLAFLELATNLASMAIETLPTRQSIIAVKKNAQKLAVEEKMPEIPPVKEIMEEIPPPPQPAPQVELPPVQVAAVTVPPPLLPEEEVKLHEEAKRFARLLVSEIKLYNEAQVALGRENKDLFERLKDDIERSKKMYIERISSKIASATNYFYEELVKTLAGGDSSVLGTDKI